MEDYFKEVNHSVQRCLVECDSELQAKLCANLSSNNIANLPRSKIEKACAMFLEKTREKLSQNVNKFELYAMRNVFTASQPTELPREGSDLDRVLDDLRAQYSALYLEYVHIATECRDMDALLKDMRTSLFNLRVAIQSLDDQDMQPLSDTTHFLFQYQSRLQRFCDDGKELLRQSRSDDDQRQQDSTSPRSSPISSTKDVPPKHWSRSVTDSSTAFNLPRMVSSLKNSDQKSTL